LAVLIRKPDANRANDLLMAPVVLFNARRAFKEETFVFTKRPILFAP
jgi:hypothetical protein